VLGYVQGMHAALAELSAGAQRRQGRGRSHRRRLETRFRYNPDVKSLPAMVPAVIPLLLMLIPAILTALARGAREGAGLDHQPLRHAGHPARVPARQAAALRRAGDGELPAAGGLAVVLFGVPLKGSFLALALGALLYVISATASAC
jgi:ribosome-dependent ATPase